MSRQEGSIGNCTWSREGRQVVITGFHITDAAGAYTIGTMPVGCRPKTYCAQPTASNGYADIGPDGVQKMTARGGGANYFTMSYPCV